MRKMSRREKERKITLLKQKIAGALILIIGFMPYFFDNDFGRLYYIFLVCVGFALITTKREII